jgi:hypothetical protein
MPALVLAAAALSAASIRAAETGPPEARLLRFPDMNRELVVSVFRLTSLSPMTSVSTGSKCGFGIALNLQCRLRIDP